MSMMDFQGQTHSHVDINISSSPPASYRLSRAMGWSQKAVAGAVKGCQGHDAAHSVECLGCDSDIWQAMRGALVEKLRAYVFPQNQICESRKQDSIQYGRDL